MMETKISRIRIGVKSLFKSPYPPTRSDHLLGIYYITHQVVKGYLILCITLLISACGSNEKDNTKTQVRAIQTIADKYIAQNQSRLSGVSITAQCNGLNDSQPITVLAGTVGHGVQENRPIQSDDIWQIGSNSKSFTSIVLLQLASDPKYKFSLDDPITKWINKNNYPQLLSLLKYKPTIRQMMNMTSGIPENFNASKTKVVNYLVTNPHKYKDPVFWINFANIKEVKAPGTVWNYANTNYDLFALLVPVITGNSLQNEVENRIIKPLGLKNTYFINDLPTASVNISRLIKGYMFRFHSHEYETSTWSLSSAVGDGSIIANTIDINTYFRNLYTTNKMLNKDQFNQFSAFISDLTGKPIDDLVISEDGQGFGLGIWAYDFAKVNNYFLKVHHKPFIKANYTNILNNINNYHLVYYYPGSTPGFTFTHFFNPVNDSSVVVGYNTNLEDDYSLPLAVLNYMDPICKKVK